MMANYLLRNIFSSLTLGTLIINFGLPGFCEALAPLKSDGVVVLDLPASTAESIQLNIEQGRFANQSVGRLVLNAQGIDFRQGKLQSLGAGVYNANFDNVLVDELQMKTAAFSFDSLELLNNRRFVLDHPVQANVSLKITEENLNNFFSNPKTIERLEKAVSKKMGNLSLISFSQPSLELLEKNRVKLSLMTNLGNIVGTPMQMEGRLNLQNGKLVFQNMALTSNGVPWPVDISDIFSKKLNELIDLERLGKNNFVIHANRLKMTSRLVEVEGQAALNRLEFGR